MFVIAVGAIATDAALFGNSEGPIFLSFVICTGDESRLSDCQGSAIGDQDCTHQQDAGVRCKGELMDHIHFYRVHIC